LRVANLIAAPHVQALLARFRDELALHFGERLREVTLFGSRARGEAHEDSDADLLVVVDDLTESERAFVLDLSWRVAFEADEYLVLAPLVYSSAQAGVLRSREKRLFCEIERDGVSL
jgi:predicted nucleotidyltransferase